MSDDDNFLSRWSRRKSDLKSGRKPDDVAPGERVLAEASRPTVASPLAGAPDGASTQARPAPDMPFPPSELPTAATGKEKAADPPPPTLADVAVLTREDSYARFVAPGVDPAVRNAAMKKLFTDPHYNVMDGLDIYIDDYGKPDPIPLAMLRRMTQSKSLGLFDHEDADADEARREGQPVSGDPGAANATDLPPVPDKNQTLPVAETSPDEDPDLQLQPDDGTRRASAGPSADDTAKP